MSTYSSRIRCEALVEAAEQVLARAPLAVRAGPHVVPGLGRDHQLVAVGLEVLGEDPAEVDLGAPVRRPVVVGEVEVGDPEVERAAQDRAAGRQRPVVAEVLPQAERDRRQLQAAAPAAAVLASLVAVGRRRGSGSGASLESNGIGREYSAARPRLRSRRTRRRRPRCRLWTWIVTAGRSPTLDPHARGQPPITSRASAAEPRIRKEHDTHAAHPPAERPRSAVGPERGALGAPDLTVADNQVFGSNVFSPGGPAPAAAQGRLPAPAADARARRGARHLARRRGRAGDEGMGAREGRHPLHALVPAADRLDRREARQLLRADRRGHGAGRVLRQGADPGRARRVELPDRRHPRHVRGARLHGLGPDQPGVHPREPERRAAVHPDGVRVVDRRGARPQDPAAALDGRALEVGDPRAEAVRRQHRRSACSRPSAPSRSTS